MPDNRVDNVRLFGMGSVQVLKNQKENVDCSNAKQHLAGNNG